MAYRDEIVRLEAMHAANPGGRVFAHLAEAYRKRGELEKARDVLQTGLERHPQYASAHVVFGRVLLDLIDPQAADEAFRRVLELDPQNMVALRARGDIAHSDGRKPEALAYYRELNSLDPSDEQTALRIAEIEAGPATTLAAQEGDVPFVIESTSRAIDEAGPDIDAAGLDIEETAPHVEEASAAIDAAGLDIEETEHAPPTDGADHAPATDGADHAPTTDAADYAPATDGAAHTMGDGAPAIDDTAESWLDEIAPPFEAERAEALGAAADYGETALPTPETEAPQEKPAEPLADASSSSGASFVGRQLEEAAREQPGEANGEPQPGDMDLGLGGMLEPTDLHGSPEPGIRSSEALFDALQSADPGAQKPLEPEEAEGVEREAGASDALAGLGAFQPAGETEPDAVVDLSGLGGHFTLPSDEDVPPDESAEHPGLPGVDEIATDATPAPIPSAPGDEPAPAPAMPPVTESVSPVADVDEAADFDSLWKMWDDGESAELPEGGTELITETIGDLYAQQGLHDRAAEVYEKLLETRAGDAAVESKLNTARAAAASAARQPEPEEPVASASEAEPAFQAGVETEEPLEPVTEAEGEGEVSEPLPLLADVDTFSALPWEEAETAQPDLATHDDLGLETIGGGDINSPAAAPGEMEDLERVEAAWTGGAGAAADVESPFGWAEPESTKEQSTIGDYLDQLIAFTPSPTPAAEPARPAQPPEPPPAAAPVDDIDELFTDVERGAASQSAPPPPATPMRPPLASPPPPRAPASAVPPTASPFGAPPAPSPLSPPPSAPPVPPAPPAAGSGPAEQAGDFEWDPFAELTPSAPPAAPPPQPAQPAEPEPQAGAEGEAGDDDEDIDMFRTWLQSLKR